MSFSDRESDSWAEDELQAEIERLRKDVKYLRKRASELTLTNLNLLRKLDALRKERDAQNNASP